MVKCLPRFEYFTVFLKNKNIIFKIRRSKSYRLCSFKRSNNLTSTLDFGAYHILANILDPLIVQDDAVELAIIILISVCIYISILCGNRQQMLRHIDKACLSTHFLTLQ